MCCAKHCICEVVDTRSPIVATAKVASDISRLSKSHRGKLPWYLACFRIMIINDRRLIHPRPCMSTSMSMSMHQYRPLRDRIPLQKNRAFQPITQKAGSGDGQCRTLNRYRSDFIPPPLKHAILPPIFLLVRHMTL